MKILIFTASAGNGHNSTAKRIKEKFLKEQPNSQIEIVDVYKSYASKLKAWTMEYGYFWLCKNWVSLYNMAFKTQEKLKFENKEKYGVHKDTYCILNGMTKKIFDFKPDLIICTYIYTAVAVTNIKRVYNIPAKVACMTLDYGISPYWECTTSCLDYMFLTDDHMIQPFLDRGFKKSQLYVTGIPIANQFYTPKDKMECRRLLGLDENLFTVVVMKASFFQIKEKHLVKELAKVNKQIQVVIVNGKDIKSKELIDKHVKKQKLNHKIINLGFTDKIPEYFFASDLIVGKAGGLTLTETIASGIPSLILNKLPQQEIYNKEYLIKTGCALPITGKTLALQLNKVLNDEELHKNMVANILKIQKPNAIDQLYNILKDIPEAEYLNQEFTDTKKQTIKKVHKERKKQIKISNKK